VVASAIGAINPNQLIEIRASIGNTTNPDRTQTPAYATPGLIDASIGASVTGSIAQGSTTTLNVTSVLWGILSPNDAISGSDGINALPSGCYVVSQLSGSAGGPGAYQISTGPPSGQMSPATVLSASTVLNVAAVAQGAVQAGQTLADTGGFLQSGTMVTGPPPNPNGPASGGPGLYTVDQQQTVFPEAMTFSMTVLAQVQPLASGDLRHMDALNLQGSHRAVYVGANIRGVVRFALRGGDLVVLPDGSSWLVNHLMEPFFDTAGWQKAIITLQSSS
jgi:hypothetical protein